MFVYNTICRTNGLVIKYVIHLTNEIRVSILESADG